MNALAILLYAILLSGNGIELDAEAIQPPAIMSDAPIVVNGLEASAFNDAKANESVELILNDAQPFESCPDVLHLTFKNNSDDFVDYPERFYIEQKIDGRWYNIPLLDGHSFLLRIQDIAPNASVDKEISLFGFPENLPSGSYRIVYETGDTIMYCEFIIK